MSLAANSVPISSGPGPNYSRPIPTLASPYFHPEFTRVIAAVRDDVEVAVIEDGTQVVAFFPFQRADASVGEPVGGIISDYQGLICAPDFVCDPRELMQQCRLAVWNFDHLLTSQSSFTAFHQDIEPSPQLDLSKGYESYVHERRALRLRADQEIW